MPLRSELNNLFTAAVLANLQRGDPAHYARPELIRIGRGYIVAVPIEIQKRLNDVAGALTLASLEFMRRLQRTDYDHCFKMAIVDLYVEFGVPHMRDKIKDNGDVYPSNLVRTI